ncbi:MAG: hypothetical protein HOP07_14980 [Bacteriovoracaceae bacterium]|nr:hypothetical protein [Bacteriovoracaceae bacterium]
MKMTLFMLMMNFTTYSFAAEQVKLSDVNIVIKTTEGLSKLEDTLKYPESLLKKFQPQGAKITHKKVSHNTVTFVGTKTYMMMSHSVTVKGTLDSVESNIGCKQNENGYDVALSFEGSDSLVYDNFESVRLKLCAKENNESQLYASLRPVLIKGRAYSGLTGPFVQSIIEAQIKPLITAVESEMLSK